MAAEVTEMLSSENDKVAELLKEAFKAHVVELSSVKCKVGELEKKCKKLEQRNMHLLHKGRDLQVKFDKINSDYDNIKKEFDETKARLSPPCKGCQMLKGQLGQQEKLYNMMLCNMYPDKSLKIPEADINTAQHDSLKHKPDDSQVKQNSYKCDSINLVEGKTKSLRLNKRARTKYSEDSVYGVKKAKMTSPEASCPERRLPLQAKETQPETQNASVNILEPETCDPDFSEQAAPLNSQNNLTDYNTKSAQQGQIRPLARCKQTSAKPNIIIPETVPFFNSFSEDENNEVAAKQNGKHLGDKRVKHQTVVCLLSPPSHASTPLASGDSHRSHKSGLMVTPEKKHPADTHDCSEPSSPVFGDYRKSVINQEMLKKLIHSPSLFDEEKVENDLSYCMKTHNDETVKKHNNVSSDVDLSVSQNDSASVLTGMSGDRKPTASISTSKSCNNEQGIKTANAQMWKKPQVIQVQSALSTNQGDEQVDSKRVIQATLKITKLNQPRDQPVSDDSYDPDETRDSKSETKERTTVSISSEQFTEPRFTSTQKCDVAVQSKGRKSYQWQETSLSVMDGCQKCDDSDNNTEEEKDSVMADKDMASMFTLDAEINGSVDPNIHLSQYDSLPDKHHKVESQVAASDNTKTKSRRGRPKQTAKTARSGRRAFRDEKSEVKHLEQDSFLAMREENGEPIPISEDSFDRLPEIEAGPGYAYVDVVRKKSERQKLKSYVCPQCNEYYDGLQLSEEEKQKRMKYCRHKARYLRPETPEHYWSISFPDTQEAEERGYLKTTQVKPSRFRRKQGLRPLFLESKNNQQS